MLDMKFVREHAEEVRKILRRNFRIINFRLLMK